MQELKTNMQEQVADNTAAVQDLELLVKHLINTSGGPPPPPPARLSGSSSSSTAVSEGWSPPTGSTTSSRAAPAATAARAAPVRVEDVSGELLDVEDRMLLERINHLASGISTEMREAVHELELQQQTLLERHQNFLTPDRGSGSAGSSPLGSVWGQSIGIAGSGSGSMAHMMPVAARWLESREAVPFFKGLLVTFMMSSGLWSDGLWGELQGEPLR